MKRKVISQGHNTLTMTLPSEWVKKFNLTRGSEVDVVEKDNGLFISTEKNDRDRKAEIDLDGLDIPTIWKYFMAVYREGYDELVVRHSPNQKLESPYKYFCRHDADVKYQSEEISALEFVHELVNRFIGFEIISHDDGSVLIRDMSEPSSKEFDTSLRRVLLLVQQMSEETFEALDNSDSKILKHIHDVDINLDKFHDYCIRILNKIGHKESRKTNLLFSTLFYLESVGDEFKSISHHLLFDFNNGNFEHVIDISESIKEQLELYFKLFYKFDREKIIRISEIDKNRYFGVKSKFKETETNEEREIFHHLRIIARYINTLTELRIEMEY